MIILGLNAFHGDSSAALLRDGVLIAAAEEERFRRVKHWAGFPERAIGYCLEEAGVTLGDVDHVSVNQNSRANLGGKLRYLVSHRPDPRLVFDRLRNRRARAAIPELLARIQSGNAFRGEVHNVEHHVAHLSSAFHVSPFRDAAVLSIDGFGDFCSAAWGEGYDTQISLGGRIFFPHSLGIFYQAITQFLGFPHYGDEYKVMGLAPYGRSNWMNAMRGLVRLRSDGRYDLNLRYFRHHRERVEYQWESGSPLVGELFTSELEKLLGPRRRVDEPLNERHKDIAHSAQAMYEEAFFHLLHALQVKTRSANLALAGGCAMNSVANGKITQRTAFKQFYVQAAAGDAGGAIGSALSVWHGLGRRRCLQMDHAYWGPQFSNAQIAGILNANADAISAAGCAVEETTDESELCRRIARRLSEGAVVGWFQGRMEWGPRALGNRSILADPRRADMKDILNAKIKRRESFRPFAPSILDRAVPEWFEQAALVPFMTQVFQVREEKRKQIPTVTHVDGSGRLQTVSQRANPRYFRLIESFEALTGVPLVLNTSFNENEPVVCEPQQALDCFLRTRMDILVLGDWLLLRSS